MDRTYEMPQVTSESATVRDKVKKNRMLLTCFALVVITVLLLVFVAVVAWKLVSLDNSLTEERDARKILVDDITALSTSVENAKRSIQKTRDKLDDNFAVAFHTMINGNPIINSNQQVIFDEISMNMGNGYNGATGVFVVPHSLGGLYFFSMHLVTEDKKYARFVIYRNTEILCGSYADNRESPGGNDAISCSVIAKLSSGDQVYVKSGITSDNEPVICGLNQCGFIGFLLKSTN